MIRRAIFSAWLAAAASIANADGPFGHVLESSPPPDEIAVPGGAAVIRRLLGVDADRPVESFLVELHEALLAGAESRVGWSQVERRRLIVEFADDLSEWRRRFGAQAVLAGSPASWPRTLEALDWLGLRVEGSPPDFSTDGRDDAASLRRRTFPDALGTPMALVLSRLRAGEKVTLVSPDAAAPLPFGLAFWKETLGRPDLTAANAFLELVKDVRASRLLIALHNLDPETRREVTAIARRLSGAGKPTLLLEDEYLGVLSRFPGAVVVAGGAFQLPGGREADPIWTDVFGASPSKPSDFLRALVTRDAGKGAYVVDALRHARPEIARSLLFGPTAADRAGAVPRFRRFYRSIEKMGEGFVSGHRDPYDFAHVAGFLTPDLEPIAAIAADLDGEEYPDEKELARIVARAGDLAVPRTPAAAKKRDLAEGLSALFRREAERGGGTGALRRFVFVSELAARPTLSEPATLALLLRGADRFFPAYAVLEDLPLDGALARRYLRALDRLDRRRGGETDVAAALFQSSVELLTHAYRAGSLDAPRAAELLGNLLDVPAFAKDDVAVDSSAADVASWTSRFLGALPAAAAADDLDELLSRALAGPPAVTAVSFSWRGGYYRFDPVEDEVRRRRQFREKQRLPTLEEAVAAARGAGEGVRGTARSPVGSPETDPSRQLLLGMLGHVYAASAGDPEDLYYEDPNFVRRHSFRGAGRAGRLREGPFAPTRLSSSFGGGGSRVTGSVFGLPDVLGLLHADQLTYGPGAALVNEQVRSGLVGAIRRMLPARLDDGALHFVDAACRAAEELPNALRERPEAQRLAIWSELAGNLVPRARLARVAAQSPEQPTSIHLSPSDLYRIGRRLALGAAPKGVPSTAAAVEAREALAGLEQRHGRDAVRARLAELGPRAVSYAGRLRLTDLDLPAYERVVGYRVPGLLADRVCDLKVTVARAVSQADLPAPVLALVLPAALDEMMGGLEMGFAYDWRAIVRRSQAFGAADLDRFLEEALRSGRIERDHARDEEGGGRPPAAPAAVASTP